jgi:SAM-dependent methyltransferase
MGSSRYEELYEAHARSRPPETAIGGGDFDEIGRLELSVLVQEGLQPTSSLLDFGCGTGRLSVHAVPYLSGGRYVGVDISETMISRARDRIVPLAPAGGCVVDLRRQTDETFEMSDGSLDTICAFSVFTHMEHEDAYRYLQAMHRLLRPGGLLVASVLPIHLHYAQKMFLASAARDLEARWARVRNVVTSIDLFEALARLAGWATLRWYDGETPSIKVLGEDRTVAFGQSIVVLEPV